MPTLSVSLNYSFPTHRATPCWFYRQQSHCLSAIVLLGNTNHPPLALPFHYHKPPRSIFLSSFFWNVSDRTCARNPKHSTAFMPLAVDTSLSPATTALAFSPDASHWHLMLQRSGFRRNIHCLRLTRSFPVIRQLNF